MASKTLTAAITGTLFTLALFSPVAADDSTPPPARQVTFGKDAATPAEHAKTIKTLTGTDVDVSAIDAKLIALPMDKLSFWPAVEKLAAETGSRIVVTGGRIALKPGKSQAASCVSGPFRFVEREVLAKIDAETGRTNYEVILDVCWEPWVLAFRMDTTPTDLQAKSDRGKNVDVEKGGSRSATAGNFASLYVRSAGIVRADRSINLKGVVRITIADEFLTFTFDANNPTAATQKGVAATVPKFGKDGTDWFAVIGLKYPKGEVVIESFEEGFFRNNTVRLVDPKGQAFKADTEELADSRYTFKKRANLVGPGWKLEYRTPGPMREITVPFELEDIKLP